MKQIYHIDEDKITREIDLGTAGKKEQDIKLPKFLERVRDKIPYDTGWMPAGLRQYTQVNDEAQMVIVLPPGINRINWGERERDENCKTYLLAQPWRILVVNLLKGDLLGARMFYSPDPISSIEQPLYHQNLPNINCLGYNGTGVGWVCLYHTEKWNHLDLANKVLKAIERCSGVEAFNNRNMSSTHGPKIYQDAGRPNYTYVPKEWEKITEKYGVMWTLDPDLWIPVKVKGRNDQDSHYKNGIPLTLEMVMNGKARFYYHEENPKQYVLQRDIKTAQKIDVKPIIKASFDEVDQ